MKVLTPTVLGLLLYFSAAAQAPDPAIGNSLEEVRDKHNVLLVVYKSRVIDASDRERAIIEDVLKADPSRRAVIAGSTHSSPKSSINTSTNTTASGRQEGCQKPIT